MSLPLDQMEIWTDVSENIDSSELLLNATDGMYIHGMCMEGAQWDIRKACVVASTPKVLHPQMPTLVVRGVAYGAMSKDGIYECPIYITAMRGGTFTFVATLRSVDPINRWVLAGVALLMSDD